MRIQALILARDEAHNLDECIGSLDGCTDAVLVCDTGSRDATVSRARALGAECVRVPWQESFAAARNAALASVQADWVLVLDADERLATPYRTRLRARLHQASPAEISLPVEVRTYTLDVEALGYTGAGDDEAGMPSSTGFVPERQPRLLRPGRGLRYVGRSCERLSGAHPGLPTWTSPPVAVLHHVRELGDSRVRERRNRMCLRLALQQFLDTGAASDAARLGALLCRARRWRAGLSYLRCAERAASGDAALHLQIGVAQLHLGLTDGAIRALRRAWQELPGHPELATHLARALLQSGRDAAVDEAGALLETALAQAPELDMAVQQLAVWHRRRREYATARAYLHMLLDRQPGHALALRELGVVALLEGRLGEAESCLRRACRARPEDADAWNNLGCVLERRGLWAAAEAAFARAARLAPGQAQAHRNLCLTHAARGDLAGMRASAAALLACSSDGEAALFALAARLLDAGWIEALQALEAWAVRTGWLVGTNLTPERG